MATDVQQQQQQPVLSLELQWWDDYNFKWTPYNAAQQTQIRQHIVTASPQLTSFDGIADLDVTIGQYGTYTLNFTRMVQINKATRFERRIRLVNKTNHQVIRGGDGTNATTSAGTVTAEYEEDFVEEEEEDDDVNDEHEEKTDIFLPVAFSTLSKTDQCVLCLEGFSEKDEAVIPINCSGHFFHRKCPHDMGMNIIEYMEKTKQCPACKKRYGTITGNMPPGKMRVDVMDMHLPGYEKDKTLQITFSFPSGRQREEHPNPGARYEGDLRYAYLPDCDEGRHVLKLLQKAWKRKLLFTIGTSVTRGLDGCIIYNGIHFKSVPYATPSSPWGWPDPTYLQRVTQELNDKGVY